MRSITVSIALCTVVTSACASHDAATTGDDQNLTDIVNTVAKQQSIANCWIYGTAAWAESLHLQSTGQALDLSEAYWSYWYWYEQIIGGDVGSEVNVWGGVIPQGYWGFAAEIAVRYGWMAETDFLPADHGATYSARQQTALSVIQNSVNGGPLSPSGARHNRALVLSELNRAWGLDPQVAQRLAQVFGGDGARRLSDPAARDALPESTVHGTWELSVGAPFGAAQGAAPITFRDILGDHAPGTRFSAGTRTGPYAWSEHAYSGPNDPLLRAMQRTLNASEAIPITWWADDATVDATGTFRNTTLGSHGYLHVSLAFDDQVEGAPGFGTLPVGVTEKRASALAATLVDPAHITILRIKNPWWGSYTNGDTLPHVPGAPPGTNDLAMDYLNRAPSSGGGYALRSMVLPATALDAANAPACSEGWEVCGGDGMTGDPNTLYRCSGGTYTALQKCPNGCQVTPKGQWDRCAGAPACPSGDGRYCGGNGVLGDPKTLYQCSGGTLTALQTCPVKCVANPAGTVDQCQ